jgi:putative membrane protein insertion efficiency factor
MKRTFIALIRIYQYMLSPVLGHHCRFVPSCSEYTQQAIAQHGVIKGTVLGAWRIVRCHPWGGSGYEPVPQTIKFFSRKKDQHAH